MWCNNCLGDMDVMEIDADKDGKRFKNFVLMIGEEVLSEMSKDLKIANIYFIPLGGEFKNKLLDILNSKK